MTSMLILWNTTGFVVFCEWKCSDMYSATCTYICIPYVLWLKDQATRKGAVSVPTLHRLWTVSDSFKLR